MTFREIWRSGGVTRYHARPEVKPETLAEHHCRVAQILCELYHPRLPSAELLFVALHHDVAELIVGDLPYPFKAANPNIVKWHQAKEGAELLRILRKDAKMTEREESELRLADRLAAHVYGYPQDRSNPEWNDDFREIGKLAASLGLVDAMWRVLDVLHPPTDPKREAAMRELADLAQECPAEPASAPPEGLGDVPATHAAESTQGHSTARVCGGCKFGSPLPNPHLVSCWQKATWVGVGATCRDWQPRITGLAGIAARDATAWTSQDGGVE